MGRYKGIFIFCVVGFLVLITALSLKDRKSVVPTLYLKGTVVSNDAIEGQDRFKNIIKLEDGSIYVKESFNKISNLIEEQSISLGDYNGAGTTTIVKIPPIK